MAVKLDMNDKKILNQLDLDCRQSDAEIGGKASLSKQVVNYRIKKMLESKVIDSFSPLFNIAKLGYGVHKVYVKFGSLTRQKEDKIWSYLTRHPNIVWIISCSGNWDIIFGIVSKDIEEFDKTLSDFMNRYSHCISSRSISVFNKATIHHRKWILQQDQKPVYWVLGGKIESNKLDIFDKNIMKLLSDDARRPVVEIAEKLNTSSSFVIQRIRRLQKNGIIGAFRTSINREKLGINYCKSFIYYQNKTTEKESVLLSYCRNLLNIMGISQSIGPWDLELEFEVKDYDEFHRIMKEIKNRFPIVRNFDTVYIEKEHGTSFLPEKLL